MARSLFDLAEAARPTVVRRFAALAARQSGATHVRDRVRAAGRVSVNLRPGALLGTLREGRMVNVFELAAREAATTGDPVATVLRRRLDRWYPARTRFERRYGGGGSFYYGALNVGGLGAPRYGRYCVVTRRRPAPAEAGLAFLATDSLKGFRDRRGGLLERRLAAGIAPPDAAPELACVKLDAACGLAEPAWAGALCSDDDYVEAVMADAPTVAQVEEVRVPPDIYASLLELALERAASGTPLAGARDLELEDADAIRSLLDERGIPWTKG